jgi:hypothetical protein
MNALRGEFDYAIALECFAFVIEYDDVTGARLRPMQTEGQQQVLIGTARDDHGEVIVDAFFQAIEHCQTQGRGQVNFRLPNRIGVGGGGEFLH